MVFKKKKKERQKKEATLRVEGVLDVTQPVGAEYKKANMRLSGLPVWRASTGTVAPRGRLTLGETV